jgi:formylglycine-generating enzyme required for sulfatase activity
VVPARKTSTKPTRIWKSAAKTPDVAMDILRKARDAARRQHVLLPMKRASSLAFAVFALPVALAACPQFASDWRLSGAGSVDGGGDATMQDAGTGSDGRTEGGGGDGSMMDSADGARDAATDALPPPSCAAGGAGMTTCPAGTGSQSCCTSLEVTGGSFDLTYTNDGGGPTNEANPATVSSLRVDEYLVTVGRFRQFVNAVLPPDGGTGWTPPAGSGIHTHLNGGQGLLNSGPDGGYENTVGGWSASWNSNIAPTNGNLACSPDGGPSYNTWMSTAGTSAQESLPINCENWWEAYAFCIWDGGFLPSEAEYEYTAAGGSQMREYPWGSTNPETGNQYAIYGCYYASGSGSCTGVANIAPVGTAALGAGYWGQLDMAGNMWEWGLDWFAACDAGACTAAPYAAICTNCSDFTAASYRVNRGGGYEYTMPTPYLLPSFRSGAAPSSRYTDSGFRCARTP